jgi:hypothetical protein
MPKGMFVIWRVAAMSHCSLIKIEGLAYKPSNFEPHDNAPFGMLR